ncbi:hypothetical protein Taro_007118 [Colocasia esculenta]|uniref:Uncharacterized protein n=1 Tax=Colocasia esculenta TaxID=4460 RepID=A0A843TZC3_COLES|nr:hypothetical protein [Colocasia esculenta]
MFSASNISLDHVNPMRGNHTESACHVDGKLCSTRRENSSPGKTMIFIRASIETPRESTIQSRHFDPVGRRSDSEISGPATKFLSGSVVVGSRCDRIRTPLRSNGYNFPLDYRNRI